MLDQARGPCHREKTEAVMSNALRGVLLLSVLSCLMVLLPGKALPQDGAGQASCSIKSNAALCKAPRGGTACVGSLPSCCDACAPDGSCVSPGSTTTTTGAPTTTTAAPTTTTGAPTTTTAAPTTTTGAPTT